MVSAADPTTYFLPRQDLDALVKALAVGGRQVIAPTIREGAVMLEEVADASALPVGWGAETAPGVAHLFQRADQRVFDQPPGPSSWKRWTFPPRVSQLVWDGEARAGAQAGRGPHRAQGVPGRARLRDRRPARSRTGS